MSRPIPTLRADALGLGLRLPHLEALEQAWPESVAYVEIISENYLGAAAPPGGTSRGCASACPWCSMAWA
ncbi:hypothetical protein ACN28S_50155 [Cystobacter fuscus]